MSNAPPVARLNSSGQTSRVLCAAFWRPLSVHCAPALHLHGALAARSLWNQGWFHDHVRIEHMLFDGAPVTKDGVIRGSFPPWSRPRIETPRRTAIRRLNRGNAMSVSVQGLSVDPHVVPDQVTRGPSPGRVWLWEGCGRARRSLEEARRGRSALRRHEPRALLDRRLKLSPSAYRRRDPEDHRRCCRDTRVLPGVWRPSSHAAAGPACTVNRATPPSWSISRNI